MIKNRTELQATFDRILIFKKQVSHLKKLKEHHLSIAGFESEISIMQKDVQVYILEQLFKRSKRPTPPSGMYGEPSIPVDGWTSTTPTN